MKISRTQIAAYALAVATGSVPAQPAAPVDLVRIDVDEAASPGGKPLKMSFAEIQREADHSIVEVIFVSGASVPSSMFVLRGMCAVLRARGARYFQSEAVGSQPTRYRVTFPPNPVGSELRGGNKKFFSEQECSMLRL